MEPIFYHGFPVLGEKFEFPSETRDLDPKTKREVTICNLFINQKLSVPEIICVLDEDHGHIVNVLLNRRVVGERRQRNDRRQRGSNGGDLSASPRSPEGRAD